MDMDTAWRPGLALIDAFPRRGPRACWQRPSRAKRMILGTTFRRRGDRASQVAPAPGQALYGTAPGAHWELGPTKLRRLGERLDEAGIRVPSSLYQVGAAGGVVGATGNCRAPPGRDTAKS